MICHYCGGMLLGGKPPAGSAIRVVDGQSYHFHCSFKVKPKEVDDGDTQRRDQWGYPLILSQGRDKGGPLDP